MALVCHVGRKPLALDAPLVKNAHDLVDRNLLIAGGSGYGKSWLASRLADGLIDSGYQLLGLDPVGDLSTLRRHATCLCLGREEVPPISLIVQLLAETEMTFDLLYEAYFEAPGKAG